MGGKTKISFDEKLSELLQTKLCSTFTLKPKMFLNSTLCPTCNWQVFCWGGVELSRRLDTGHISKLCPKLPQLWLRGIIKLFAESQTLWGPAGTTSLLRVSAYKLQHLYCQLNNFCAQEYFPFIHLFIYTLINNCLHNPAEGKLYYFVRYW